MSRNPFIVGSNIIITVLPSVLVASEAYAVQYLTIEEAQHEMFPEAKEFSRTPIQVTPEQKEAIEERVDIEFEPARLKIWKVLGNDSMVGYFVVDQVIGKHEFITYAVALSADLEVQSVNILEYLENYGAEVTQEGWRRQFRGKTASDELKLGSDIQNISGATFSCRHVTEGVKKILLTLSEVHKSGA